MARRTGPRRNAFEECAERIRTQLEASPLKCVHDALLEFILGASAANDFRAEPVNDPEVVTGYVYRLLEEMPATFGDRFWFDAAHLQTLCESWRERHLALPALIVPSFGSDWGWASRILPTNQRNQDLGLVFVRGGDKLNDIRLLEYPWICHELGHALLIAHAPVVFSGFTSEINRRVTHLKKRGLADKEQAKPRGERIVDGFAKLWTPTANQSDWAHEIAIDHVALWTCGPAYLAAVEDASSEAHVNPYLITQEHPPYAVRVSALLSSAAELGWASETGTLAALLEKWRDSDWSETRDKNYAVFAHPEIVETCRQSALLGCRELGLPQCTPAIAGAAQKMVDNDELPNFGTELLLAAWYAYSAKGESNYLKWEEATIAELRTQVTQ